MPDHLPRLDIICFGPPTATVDGAPPPQEVLWRKHLALLIYLALSPNCTRSREHLLGLLWPEKEEKRARQSLSEAIHRLKHGLGAERIIVSGDTVTLNGDGLHVDALDPPGDHQAGQLLEGFTLKDAPAFDDWLTIERTRLEGARTTAYVASGERVLAALRFGEAAEAALAALALNPLSEPGISLLMRTRALAGDPAGALAAFHEYEARLRDEIAEAPSKELTSLAERIRTNRWRTHNRAEQRDEPPLVGRLAEHARAFGTLNEAQAGGARVLLMQAESGAGKTRLLRDCADRWQLAGGVVASASPLEGDREASWSTLRLLLQGGLLDAPGMVGTDPEALASLAAVAPAVARITTPAETADRAQVAHGMASLFGAVAEEIPLAVAIDNLQFADGDTIAALGTALDRIPDLPVLLVATVAVEREAAPEVDTLLAEVGRTIAGSIVRLPGLTAPDLRLMVEAMATWCTEPEQQDRLARRLAFESGGNAFFATTLLRGLQDVTALREDAMRWPPPGETVDAPVPMPIPDLMRMMTVARVKRLPDVARELVVTASVGDRVLDLAVLRELTEHSTAEIEEAVGALERHDLARFDGERFAFSAPLIPRVVSDEFLTPGQRELLRQRYARVRARTPAS